MGGSNRVVYVHCYGGPGRAGIVGCALLWLYFHVTAEMAVEAFNTLHAERLVCGVGGPALFPHSARQLEQVERVAKRVGAFEGLLRHMTMPDLDAGSLAKDLYSDMPEALPV